MRAGYLLRLYRAAGDLCCGCNLSIQDFEEIDTLVVNDCIARMPCCLERYPGERHHIIIQYRRVAAHYRHNSSRTRGKTNNLVQEGVSPLLVAVEGFNLSGASWSLLFVRVFLLLIFENGLYYCEIRTMLLFASVLVTFSVAWCVLTFSCKLAILIILVRISFSLYTTRSLKSIPDSSSSS